jgi:16S rRNA (uracil1498-N3)-methyltransferase
MAKIWRLFAATLPPEGGVLVLSRETQEHAQVLRLGEGTQLCLFDGAGSECDARIVRVERGRIECEAEAPRPAKPRGVALTLVVAVPKLPKLETIVRMTTELGVDALRLAESERSVPKLSADSPKLERLRRITREACAQSGSARALEIHAPEPLQLVAAQAPTGAKKLVFWEQAEQTLSQALGLDQGAPASEVWVVIGPEGGFSAEEASLLGTLGYAPVGLGENILRVDTAAVVAAALLLDRLGALRC